MCGKVVLTFLQPVPVMHVHCCCCDCRQAREWIASIGGPPMKGTVSATYYFVNDLAEPEPETVALLRAFKLRDTGQTIRLVSTCCSSIMATDHPYYEGNVVAVGVGECLIEAPHIEPLCRIFSKDWDAAYDGEMPPATASLEDTEATSRLFEAIVRRPVTAAKGMTIQGILSRLPAAKSLGLAENMRLLPRP